MWARDVGWEPATCGRGPRHVGGGARSCGWGPWRMGDMTGGRRAWVGPGDACEGVGTRVKGLGRM